MIVLLGSSYTRGAWGDHMEHPDAFVHTLLSNELNCTAINMSIPGCGSEIFVDAYIHAVDKYKPSLFLAELVEDRSRRMMYLPNDISQSISAQSAELIHDQSFQYGMPGMDYNENQMDQYRIHGGAGTLRTYDKRMFRNQRMLDNCHVQGHGHTLKTLLDWFNILNVFHESDSLELMRTIKNFMSLEKLSKLIGVPVLYYRYNQSTAYESKLSMQMSDRYLNNWHGMKVGTCDWADGKLNGSHLADHTHLTKYADELVIHELIAPFIKDYAARHSIIL